MFKANWRESTSLFAFLGLGIAINGFHLTRKIEIFIGVGLAGTIFFIVFIFSSLSWALEVSSLHTCLKSLNRVQPAADLIENSDFIFVRKIPQNDGSLRLILVSEKNIHICTSSKPSKSTETLFFELGREEKTSFISYGPILYGPNSDSNSFPYDRFVQFKTNINPTNVVPKCAYTNSLTETEVPEVLTQINKSLEALYVSPYPEKNSGSVDILGPMNMGSPNRVEPSQTIYKAFFDCAKLPVVKKYLNQTYDKVAQFKKHIELDKPGYKYKIPPRYDEEYLIKFGSSGQDQDKITPEKVNTKK